jgi:hypothetical protein
MSTVTMVFDPKDGDGQHIVRLNTAGLFVSVLLTNLGPGDVEVTAEPNGAAFNITHGRSALAATTGTMLVKCLSDRPTTIQAEYFQYQVK